ncbi:MAG TPA: RHS repeat-associated core domain-containing protein, partial [Aequorivita sp.]|nr:RHS repeat-associated core domain-containing protein [Aequorivita sp.]
MVVIEPFDGANIIQTFLDATRVIKSFRPGDGSFEQWKGFTGKEYDPETGLYYFNARWYDQSIGRFISEDPVRDPNNPNLYTYARNNPLRFIDPTGLISLADIGLSTATTGLSSKELNEIQIDKPNSSAPKPPTPPSTSANPADFRRLEQELSKISSGMPPDPTPELPKDGPRTSDEWEKRWFEAQENEDIATLGKLLEERYQGFVYDPNIITPLATQFYAYQQGDREPTPIVFGFNFDLMFEGTSWGYDFKNMEGVYSKSLVSSIGGVGPF